VRHRSVLDRRRWVCFERQRRRDHDDRNPVAEPAISHRPIARLVTQHGDRVVAVHEAEGSICSGELRHTQQTQRVALEVKRGRMAV